MSKRVTVVLQDWILKKCRAVQADAQRKTDMSVSFSKIINELLDKGLKVKWNATKKIVLYHQLSKLTMQENW